MERIARLMAEEPAVFQTHVSFNAQKCLRPERDAHAWLAETLSTRAGWTDCDELLFYAMAAPFSVLPEERAAAAFAIRVLFDEEPGGADRLEDDFTELVTPAFELLTSGEFTRVWRRLNPWTAARFPEIADGIAMTLQDLPGAREVVELIH